MDTAATTPITETKADQAAIVAPPEQKAKPSRAPAKPSRASSEKTRARSRTPAGKKEEVAPTPTTSKPPPPPPPGVETVSTERGRSPSKKRTKGKTRPAAAENEQAKEAPPAKKSKEETAHEELTVPSRLSKSDLCDTAMRVSKLARCDKEGAARIQEIAATVDGADYKTLKASQAELLAIYSRNYKGAKAAGAEATTATGRRVKTGKEKAPPPTTSV